MGNCYSDPHDSPETVEINIDKAPRPSKEEGDASVGGVPTKEEEKVEEETKTEKPPEPKPETVVITEFSVALVDHTNALQEYLDDEEQVSDSEEDSDDEPTKNPELMARVDECLKKQNVKNMVQARMQFIKLYKKRKIRRIIMFLADLKKNRQNKFVEDSKNQREMTELETLLKWQLRDQISKVPPTITGKDLNSVETAMFLLFRDEKIENILVAYVETSYYEETE